MCNPSKILGKKLLKFYILNIQNQTCSAVIGRQLTGSYVSPNIYVSNQRWAWPAAVNHPRYVNKRRVRWTRWFCVPVSLWIKIKITTKLLLVCLSGLCKMRQEQYILCCNWIDLFIHILHIMNMKEIAILHVWGNLTHTTHTQETDWKTCNEALTTINIVITTSLCLNKQLVIKQFNNIT